MITPLMPRQSVPDFAVPTVGGDSWTLSAQSSRNFTMVVFYRGYHCPICARYLGDLDKKIAEFDEQGVTTIAVSSDGRERAEQARTDWKLESVPIGYDLSLDMARKWGLYISTSRGKTSAGIEEPPLFSEPGLFLVKPDRTLYWATVQTMPFARPHFAEVLGAVKMVLERDYPARGEVVDHKAVQAAE